jgi:hypothetical protein
MGTNCAGYGILLFGVVRELTGVFQDMLLVEL